ncbi:MAG: hypothetical protein C0490_28585 [Marivirga sp.]|nr:hypothetical protein [Marivirga sp.]
MEQSIALLSDFSEQLFVLFDSMVRLISILPPDRRPRSSFSCRSAYLGGIFIDTSSSCVNEIAEDLLHEAIHQCLWARWLLLGDTDLLNDIPTVQSPFTGRLISLNVMLQAFVIYSCSYHFHRCMCGRLGGIDGKRFEFRLAQLAKKIPILRESLRVAVRPYRGMSKFYEEVEYISMDIENL